MNITIEVPDEMNQQLAGIKNINAFVVNALKTALATQAQAVPEDSLLNLSGILTFEKNDVGEHHDDYLGQSVKND